MVLHSMIPYCTGLTLGLLSLSAVRSIVGLFLAHTGSILFSL